MPNNNDTGKEVSNSMITSPFHLYSWNYIKNINGYKSNNAGLRTVLTGICILTGAIILGKIGHGMYSSADNNILDTLINNFSNDIGNKIISFLLAGLISVLFIFQSLGLSRENYKGSLWQGSVAIMVLYGLAMTFIPTFLKNKKFMSVPIALIIGYYVLVILLVKDLDCHNDSSNNNAFEKNCYISKVNCPMTFIILALLFAYVICMSILRVFSKKSDNCEGKFTSLRKCINGLRDTLETDANKSKIQKLVEDLDKIQTTLKGLKSKPVSQDSYKNIMAIIIINIIVILSGFNMLLWFIRPEIFITLLVIQRLWFGSTYSTTANGNTFDKNGKGDTKKSWDLIGMPLVRWAMYLSNIGDGDVTHKILYGETNRKTFQPFNLFSSIRKGVTGIDPNK